MACRKLKVYIVSHRVELSINLSTFNVYFIIGLGHFEIRIRTSSQSLN